MDRRAIVFDVLVDNVGRKSEPRRQCLLKEGISRLRVIVRRRVFYLAVTRYLQGET